MSDQTDNLVPDQVAADALNTPSAAASAGHLLREARQAQGMDLDVLAAILKVPVNKLQALEADQYDLLPDTAFTRSLAIAVCKRLRIDDSAVLSLLPGVQPQSTIGAGVDMSAGLRPMVLKPQKGRKKGSKLWWMFFAVLLIVLLVLYFMPAQWRDAWLSVIGQEDGQNAATVVLPAAIEHSTTLSLAEPVSQPDATESVVVVAPNAALSPLLVNDGDTQSATTDVASQLTPAVMPSPVLNDEASAATVGGDDRIRFSATAESWITVTAQNGDVLAERLLRAGDTLDVLLKNAPVNVVVGAIGATTVQVRGKPFDLTPYSRGNVARFEVK